VHAGLTTTNIGAVALNGYTPLFGSCTPKGCVELIKSVHTEPLEGKQVVVVGASNIVGIPLSLMLLAEGCTVTTCHIHTVDTAAQARNADILIVAVGKAGLVTRDWIKPGALHAAGCCTSNPVAATWSLWCSCSGALG
jgi:methylenetetrahydrofolate dehydrogenase (NADP+)/methenyltetrahydrofolate cyclohydrolase